MVPLKTENKMKMMILSLLPSTVLHILVIALRQEAQTKSIFRQEVIKLYMQKTGLCTQIILSKLQKWNLISDFGTVAEYKISITKINSTSNSEKQKMESKIFKV